MQTFREVKRWNKSQYPTLQHIMVCSISCSLQSISLRLRVNKNNKILKIIFNYSVCSHICLAEKSIQLQCFVCPAWCSENMTLNVNSWCHSPQHSTPIHPTGLELLPVLCLSTSKKPFWKFLFVEPACHPHHHPHGCQTKAAQKLASQRRTWTWWLSLS